MIRLRTVRARLAAWIAAAVVVAGVFQGGSAVFVFLMHERSEAEAGEVEDAAAEQAENRTVLLELAGAIALVAVVLSVTAAATGVWLAGKALAPLRDAAERARAARSGATGPLLPVRGVGDEWDRLASVVNELIEEERRTAERARTFGANAAHELRTPLTGILGEVQVALRRPRTDEEYRAVLAAVESEVLRLSGVVEALLVLSRADSTELAARREDFDVAVVAAEAVARKGLDPRALAAPADPMLARGDPLLTRRVLDNLLDNAVRHGGAAVEVCVGRAPGTIAVSVTDDGPGLSPGVRTRLFERFNREPGGAEGHGLGLSIARALARAQGGELRLDEAAPHTTFVVELPGTAASALAG
ncbi:MAG TPA: ATP-binding protein [Anaeromyxobacteraceae bacterium]|nr:ATP-binding protein [Anaeromyxobacteraceae bacterium]